MKPEYEDIDGMGLAIKTIFAVLILTVPSLLVFFIAVLITAC